MNREKIILAAVALADEEGLDALSMRSLSRRLGVGAMSLYNHVKDKDDLLDGMIEEVAREISYPEEVRSWRQELRGCVMSAYQMMSRHRWLPQTWGRSSGPVKNLYHEALLRIMTVAGFSEDLACQGFHALTMHVNGFALQIQEMPFSTRAEFIAFAQKTLVDLDESTYPHLRAHVQYHLAGRDTRSSFEYMLDLILDGLEREHL